CSAISRWDWIKNGFWLAKFECSNADWMKVIHPGEQRFPDDKLSPMAGISWLEIQKYIATLNQQTKLPKGWEFALPTQTQWEYGCRSGTSTAFHMGDLLTPEMARFNSQIPVASGKYPSTAWGVHDMHGNLSEWCVDVYLDPNAGECRIIRGGSYLTAPDLCRSASKSWCEPTRKDQDIGFRLVLVKTN
ncbi:MAG: formylglycine-generating enzyme family protein, partial [Verrucomicrobiota bacterium]